MFESNRKIESSLWWLRRGFWLLPVQPGTKHTCAGFGVHQEKNKLRKSEQLREWFAPGSRYNLAVVGWPGAILLDFDDIQVYNRWAEGCPAEAQTYTETTPRGGKHVFMFGAAELPAGGCLVAGVELKQTVLIAPSIVDGKPYTAGSGEILEVNPSFVFTPITASQPQPQPIANPSPSLGLGVVGAGVVKAIKAKITPVDIIRAERPSVELIGLTTGKRWVSCRCPFHDDQTPSMWIDTQRGLWGCRSCNIHGDAINLYARFAGVVVDQAIKDLAGRLATW